MDTTELSLAGWTKEGGERMKRGRGQEAQIG